MYVHCMCSNSQLTLAISSPVSVLVVEVVRSNDTQGISGTWRVFHSSTSETNFSTFAMSPLMYILSGFAPATMSLHVRINILLIQASFLWVFLPVYRGVHSKTSKQRQLALCSLFLSWRRRSHDCESAHATAAACATSNMYSTSTIVWQRRRRVGLTAPFTSTKHKSTLFMSYESMHTWSVHDACVTNRTIVHVAPG